MANVMTLNEMLKRQDANGKYPPIVEMLDQMNEVLTDVMWKEGNQPFSELTVMRTGLPEVYWRIINQPVPTSSSTTAEVTETCAMMEAWAEVDQALVDKATANSSEAEFLLTESKPFVEAMGQKFVHTLFYGNSAIDTEQFTGLSVRYSSLSAVNAQNIIDAGGTGSDNTSVWLLAWGDTGLFGIIPQGSTAGLKQDPWEKATLEAARTDGTMGIGGARMRVMRQRFEWQVGLCLKDWRTCVRIANIDMSDLVDNNTDQAALLDLMVDAYVAQQQADGLRKAYYMRRDTFKFLNRQRYTAVQAGGGISWDTVDGGKRQASFMGIPIRFVDALLDSEERVVA